MNLEKLHNLIEEREHKLISASNIINESLNNFSDIEDFETWLQEILKNDEKVLNVFDLPTSKETRSALTTLLTKNTKFRGAILKLLIDRVISFRSMAMGLRYYAKNDNLKRVESNLKKMGEICGLFSSEYTKPSTVRAIATHLGTEVTRNYKRQSKETDLRLVLKTIMFDENRQTSEEAFNKLLDYIFKCLAESKKERTAIPISRHAWWALKDTLTYRETKWLLENSANIIEILKSLCADGTWMHTPKGYNVEIQESSAEYHNVVWVLENAVNIFKLCQSAKIKNLIPGKLIEELRDFIIKNFEAQLQIQRPDNIRNLQCDLILFYEVESNFDIIYQSIIRHDFENSRPDQEITNDEFFNRLG